MSVHWPHPYAELGTKPVIRTIAEAPEEETCQNDINKVVAIIKAQKYTM